MVDEACFSQLWVEERAYLSTAAAAVRREGVIVEIGTAQGGSAAMMARAARERGATIHSFDIAPSREAYANLAGLPVRIHAMPSAEGAGRWPQLCGQPIDLLFIDGSHALGHVVEDFLAWRPFLAPDARVLFHDYDPLRKGGYPHLGVRVGLDGFVAAQALIRTEHVGRLWIGVDGPFREPAVPERFFVRAFTALSGPVADILDGRFSRCFVAGAPWGALEPALGLLDIALLRDRDAARACGQAPLLFHCGQTPGDGDPCADSAPLEGAVPLTDLHVLSLLSWAMRHRRDAMLERVSDRKRFFKYEEQLEMLDIIEEAPLPRDVFALAEPCALPQLSRRVAREIVRLGFLHEIGQSLIPEGQ